MRSPIIVIGGGGHAGVVIATLRAGKDFEVVGIVDRDGSTAVSLQGITIVGTDKDIEKLRAEGVAHAAVGVGSAPDNAPRHRIFCRLRTCEFTLPPIVHPRAWVADGVALGDGVQVMAGAMIQGPTTLGDNVLVNTGAIIEHDSRIGDHAHIATGARLGGGVDVGNAAFVGIGSTVRQGIRIGSNAVIGAGSVVVDDVADGAWVAGVPAQTIARRTS